MALDPIVVGCDWQAAIVCDAGNNSPASVVQALTGATLSAVLEAGGQPVATLTAVIVSAETGELQISASAATTAILATGTYAVAIRVLTQGGSKFPITLGSEREVRVQSSA